MAALSQQPTGKWVEKIRPAEMGNRKMSLQDSGIPEIIG